MKLNRLILLLPLGVCFVPCGRLAAADPATITALGENFPKAIHYRYANNFPTQDGEEAAYQFWMANFGTIMGAELDWRVTELYPDRIPVGKRIKRDNPHFLIPYYLTGHIAGANDPLAREFSSGHWAYFPPVRVLQDIPAEEGESTIKVAITKAAKPSTGAYVDADWGSNESEASFGFGAGRGDDICLYALKENGTPDWENAEHVLLLSMDEKAGQITVKRGQYGSTSKAFKGRVFAAPHIQVTKFQGWRYNFHPDCARDSKGRQAVDVWVDAYARPVLTGGVAAHFDGVQLDTMVEDMWHGGRGMDLNNDQKPDRPSEMSKFSAGVAEAMRKLQAKLAPHGKLLLPDAANRGFRYVNGWEVEGFPGRHDPDWRKYSEVANVMSLSEELCVEPKFTMVQHKIFNYQISQLTEENKQVMLGEQTLPFHLSRAVMALSTAHDTALTWYSVPPKEADGRAGVYDEMRMGNQNRLGWLGKPVGSRIFPALNAGTKVPVRFASAVGSEMESRPGEPALLLVSEPFESPGPDLTVMATLAAPARTDLGTEAVMPRNLIVELEGGSHRAGYLIPADPSGLHTGAISADGQARYLKPGEGLERGWVQEYDALTVHAAGAKGETRFWEADCDVPEAAILDLRAFGNGGFRVVAAEVGGDGSVGEFREVIAPFVQAGPAFFRRSADLKAAGFGGKRVRFRFLSQPNTVWGQPTVGVPDAGGRVAAGPIKQSIRGFVSEEAFPQQFHFNSVPVGSPLTLKLWIEGKGPLTVGDISVFAGPAAVAREYEHGVVLANASPRPFSFDLAKLFPGSAFRRLKATPTQDTVVNNGQPVGGSVEIAAFDGLFLVRESKP